MHLMEYIIACYIADIHVFLFSVVINIIDVKNIQAGVNEVLFFIKENSCALNATDMCIITLYNTNFSNYTKNVQRYRNVIETGILKLENLLEDTQYVFSLMIVENCNYSYTMVGWHISGSFSTKGTCQ